MENKSKNTSEISQWIDNYLHISLDTEEYVEVRNFLILWNLFEAKWFKCNFGRNKRNIQNIHLTSDYNRGIQMYRFPNSDVQKSVIFEGIKKRLKIV